jgi:alpha-D-ribose 1-methylphosphonate 5-triphosphate diphosphatase
VTLPTSLAITHANLVLEREIIEDASLLVRDGVISDFGPCSEVDAAEADVTLDAGRSMYLLPGLIDTHNDGLEGEINPRPRAALPAEFALQNYERRSVSGGVTTSFHAVAFMNMARTERTVMDAAARTAMLRKRQPYAAIDHLALHRLDVWTPEGVAPLFQSMRQFPVQALSLNDHTPGQGQYRDLETFKKTMQAYRANDPSFDAEAEIERRISDRADDTETVPAIYERVRQELAGEPYIIASHDDDSADKVDQMVELGSTIAEFPVVGEAAERARERGLWITVGAPNIVRGGSTSGNSDATELVRLGLADIICADYHAPSMLLAAFKLAELGACSLIEALAKVTVNPARAFGLEDRGRIEHGLRADLVMVDVVDGMPVAQAVFRAGEPALVTKQAAAGMTRVGPLAAATA